MRYSTFITTSALATSALAAYVPSDPWTVLTPSASAPTGAITDHDVDFGIQIVTVETHVSQHIKRDVVNQIGDGQIQKQTSATLSKPTPTSTAKVINQIGDGQIQHQTSTAKVVNQIGDGQIQHQTSTAKVVNQIGDGQIQHQTSTAKVVNQIGDGQIQHQTSTASVINQIGDGQIQHQTTSTANVASQIGDGQVQQATDAPSASQIAGDKFPVACGTQDSLKMKLKGGILSDSHGRIGAIVANRQFQFDGPPQAGTIYAAGWSISADGYLTLGNQTEFYQCLSGDFYNLYDESIGAQCAGVKFSIIDLVSC